MRAHSARKWGDQDGGEGRMGTIIKEDDGWVRLCRVIDASR
jgi:hypothetical protein